MCLADVVWHDGSDVVASPRQILRRQLARLAERGWTRERRHRARVHRLPRQLRAGPPEGLPLSSSRPTSTTSTTRCSATARVEPLIRRIRNSMAGRRDGRSRTPRASATSASTRSTSTTPTRCAPPTSTSIYKNGAKEIAAEMGMAITYMAKYNEREGNSCHIHFSLDRRGRAAVRARPRDLRRLPRRPARGAARADAAARAERQLLQALRGRARSRRRRSPGATTTAPARCASSATARRCASRTARAAPTSTPTSRCRR